MRRGEGDPEGGARPLCCFPEMFGHARRPGLRWLRWAAVAGISFFLGRGIIFLPNAVSSNMHLGGGAAALIIHGEIPPKTVWGTNSSNIHQGGGAAAARKRRRKVILFGPHDRYNFGDLLFSQVLAHLLVHRAGYDRGDILQGGLIDVDMSAHGGWARVLGLKLLQETSGNDAAAGPYDVIYIGGEAMKCRHGCAVRMLPTEEQRRRARRDKVHECGYLPPKELFRGPRGGGGNRAALNSLGGEAGGPCQEALDTADYVSFRDKDPLYPDSACMVRELFGSRVDEAAENVTRELFGGGGVDGEVPNYIAVQHKSIKDHDYLSLAEALDEVSKNADGAHIILFAAGTVPTHDSFDTYRRIAALMTQPVKVCETTNIWEVVGLISRASAVLGTSLHVRIMAFIYWKPRVTWCPSYELKHHTFISVWEAKDAPRCLPFAQESDTWSVLRDYYGAHPRITQASTRAAYERIKTKYLESFDNISNILANE